MRGIVYASRARVAFDVAALRELAAQAAARNAALGITGYLYFENGRFFHYLEGEQGPVTALTTRIELDLRHEIQHMLFDDGLERRRFPAWSMRALGRDEFAGLDSLVYGHVLFMKHARLATSPSIWRLIDDVAALRTGTPAR
jgi:hypothetical protein